MTTYVVLTGLMLLVPRTDSTGAMQSLTVLVLETENAPDQFGHPIEKHWATVQNLGGKAGPPLSGSWTIKSSSQDPIEIDQRDRFLDLEEIYSARQAPDASAKLSPLSIREACLGSDFVTGCTHDGRALVRAQLTLEGGWRLRPVAISKSRVPMSDVDDDSLWGVLHVPQNGLPLARPGFQRKLASGVILEPLDDGAVSFEHNRTSVLEHLSPSTQCGTYVGLDAECVVVRFTNTTEPENAEVHASGDHLEIDTHFNLYYELFDPVPEIRYLPFLRTEGNDDAMEKLGYTGGGTVGGTRPCPPSVLAPKVDL